MAQHTPGPYFVGAQNDALFIVAGREPARSNDYPWHDAPRVALAKVFGPSEGDCIPIDAMANAQLFAAAPELLRALEALRNHLSGTPNPSALLVLLAEADITIAKARGEA